MSFQKEKDLLAKIRTKHGDAQASICAYAKTKSPNGIRYSMAAGLDTAATAFMLYSVYTQKMTPDEAIKNFVDFIADVVIEEFVEIPDIEKLIKARAESESRDSYDNAELAEALMDAAKAVAGSDPNGFIATGESLQEIADQVQAMADAENATQQ